MTPKPTVPARLIAASDLRALSCLETTGLGLFLTRFSPDQPLLFYSNTDRSRDHQPTAVDSVVFSGSVGMPQIATAPPWLVPERLKMDYQIILFRVMSVGQNHLEILVNAQLGKTLYVDRTAGNFRYWSDFLLQAYALNPIDRHQNPVRVRPFAESSVVREGFAHLRAIRVQDEWVFVQLYDDDQNVVSSGWLLWRANGTLVVQYDFLS